MSVVTINSYAVIIEKNSLNISMPLEGRKAASFTVIDREGNDTYADGQIVEIEDDDSNLVFSGVISGPERWRMAPSGGRYHFIQCIDWHYLADKRFAAESYQAKTAGYIADDLFDNYLAAEGVTIGSIETGPTITEMVINYVRLSDSLDALAEKAGFIWYIDENKAFYFVSRETNTAPWAITDTLDIVGTPRQNKGNPLYRNRQYIRGVKAVTDEQTETRTGDGELKSFSMGFPLAQEPTITVNAAAQTVGIKGVETGKQWYWSKGDNVVYADTAPTAAAVISVSYYGQYNLICRSEDRAQIIARKAIEGGTGTGYVEDIADEPDLTTKEAAFESAANKLATYAVNASKFNFQTYTAGLRPGQLMSIAYPLLDIDTDMLISNVNIQADGELLLYDVTAIEGPDMGSWSKFFKKLADKPIIVDKINLGQDDTLVILEELAEETGLSESIGYTVWACHTCDGTVCADGVRIVC